MQGNTGSRFVRGSRAFALGGFVALGALADSSSQTVSDSSVTVIGPDPVTMEFPVARGGDPGYDVYLDYRTADDSAVAGSDYAAAEGRLLIPAGQSTATIPVPVFGSSTPKSDRAFKLELLGAVGVGPMPSFGSATSFPVTTSGYPQPQSVATGDFNGDGRPDLVTANSNANTVSILLNDTAPGAGSASYVLVASPAVGNLPASVAVGDFNGDGLTDIAVANLLGNSVSILLNHTAPGAASVSFTPGGSPGTGAAPNFVAVSDLNGDGKLDLVVANASGNSISVLLNGTAAGASSVSFTAVHLPVGLGPYSVAVADFNGDGKPDLATADHNSNVVSILLNGTAPGASTASFTLTTSLQVGEVPTSVAAGDFNGDGLIDLAATNYYDNRVVILLNGTAPGATTASFTLAGSATVGTFADTVEAGDFNGDGKLDLAVANLGSNNISILVNATVPGATDARFVLAASPAVPGMSNLVVADLNGDGTPDLATVNRTETASVLLNTTPAPTASFALAASAGVSGLYDPVTTAAGDFNGDGKPDLAVVGYSNDDLWVLLNSTAPGASSASFTPTALTDPGSYPTGVAIGDFNGDGRPDLAVANTYGRNVSIYFNNTAPGASSASFALIASPEAGNAPAAVATGDFNGDGKLDLAVANRDGEVAILFNDTAPGASGASFTLAVIGSSTFGLELCCVVVGDFNGDGKADVAVANIDTDTVSILLNQIAPDSSTASFAPAVDLAVGNMPRSLTMGDFNGDGRPDLAVANGGSSAVSVLLNTTAPGAGSASFTLGASVPVGVYSSAVAAGDFDGDGRLDLAVANNSTTVSILRNSTAPGASSASFTPVASSRTGDYPSAVVIGDFNGDGRPELATADRGDGYGGVSVLLSTQYQASASGSATGTIHYSIPVAGLSPSSLDFGDQVVGTYSAAQIVHFSNSGNAPLTISSIDIYGDFFYISNCFETLTPGQSCAVSVYFQPSGTGARSGTLSAVTNAPGSPAVVSLSGNGVLKYDTQLTAYPALGTLLPLQLNLNVSALLQAAQPAVAPLAGKPIVFTTVSGQPICTATTDASGKAVCPGSGLLSVLLGGGSYQASFAGDANYNASSASAPLLALTP